jgi:beta-phosphoglucomutase-like phosphatase (HAD superfamily)
MGGLIFDFDGVIADSEALANTVLAETVSSHGLSTTLEQALNRYMGKRWPEVIGEIETGIGRTLPDTFSEGLKRATLNRFREELREVAGATAFIRQFSHLPRSIASSSSIDRLRLCLNILGLEKEFAHVYSGDMVERGKPHPDIFLFAAERMGVEPSQCIVIEDSEGGVRAGLAAGMTVIGLCAASHLRVGHTERLLGAGAHYVAGSWDQVVGIVERVLE